MNMNCIHILESHQETLQDTLEHMRTIQVVSFLAFSARKTPQICFVHLYAPHDVVGHTPSYIVSNSAANWTDGS